MPTALSRCSRCSARPARSKRSPSLSAPIARSSPSGEISVASTLRNDRLDPSVLRICAVALFGALLAQLDATIVNVSLSNLAADLKTSLSTIQWVTSGYLLALTLVLPLNGWLVDRIGAKALYLRCFAAFTLSSALCGLAWSANALIGFRVLQGVSGGLLAPMTQMMLARAAGKHMARVAGYMALPVLMAPVLGPIIAGAILQYASWRWLFLVNLPVGAIAFLLAVLFLPNDGHEAVRRTLDWVGLALLSPGLAMFLYGSEQIGRVAGRGLLAAGIAMIAVFLWTARRKGDDALIDLRLFKGKVFSAVSITQFLSNGGMFAGQMLIPAFLIQACGRAPAEMGWMLAPLGIGMMLTNPLMGALTDRFGIRRVSAGGALLTLVATTPLLYLATHRLVLFVLIPALFLRGMGLSGVGLPSLTAAYASVSRQKLPMATTSLNIVQRLGGPTMTTLCASFLTWKLGSHVAGHAVSTAYAWAFLLLCGLHAFSLLAAIRLPRRLDDVAIGE
jgi:EmrB/QacA subfamily drug resistance transporter